MELWGRRKGLPLRRVFHSENMKMGLVLTSLPGLGFPYALSQGFTLGYLLAFPTGTFRGAKRRKDHGKGRELHFGASSYPSRGLPGSGRFLGADWQGCAACSTYGQESVVGTASRRVPVSLRGGWFSRTGKVI